MQQLVEKEYLNLVLDIESEIITLDALQQELQMFYHEANNFNAPPEEMAHRQEELDFAVQQYHTCKDGLLELLEEWLEHTKRLDMPYDINYYRVLKQLRELETEGY